MGSVTSTFTEVRPAQRTSFARYRHSLWLLTKRDLRVRYSTSALGYVWSILDPLVMSAIYWFVFTQILKRSVGEDPYIVFLLAALLPCSPALAAPAVVTNTNDAGPGSLRAALATAGNGDVIEQAARQRFISSVVRGAPHVDHPAVVISQHRPHFAAGRTQAQPVEIGSALGHEVLDRAGGHATLRHLG